ncbi:hypothetical protein N752_27800 [Desulforamulus aquiferis]|nr:hypothetical protein N752_27800 [Desulforamulus aquiferis]
MDINNIKRFVAHFSYAIFICYVLYNGILLDRQLYQYTANTYNPYPRQFFLLFFTIFLGLLLAIPRFVKKINRPGSWSVDWIILVSVGLPALYLWIQKLGTLLLSVNYSP